MYSYDEVRFGERTAAFFRVAFVGESVGQSSRGHRGSERGGREGSERLQRGTRSDDREESGRRLRESRGRGGHGGRGAAISLEEVSYYSIIFAFATMLTYTIDGLAKHAARRRRAA